MKVMVPERAAAVSPAPAEESPAGGVGGGGVPALSSVSEPPHAASAAEHMTARKIRAAFEFRIERRYVILLVPC